MKIIDFLAEDSKACKVKASIPAPTFERTVLYYRAFLAFGEPLKDTICMISETRCNPMLGGKLQIACCAKTLQLKNVRTINR